MRWGYLKPVTRHQSRVMRAMCNRPRSRLVARDSLLLLRRPETRGFGGGIDLHPDPHTRQPMAGHPAEDAVGPRRRYSKLHVVGTLLRQSLENLGGIRPRKRGVHRLVGDGAFSRNDLRAVRRS